MDCKSSCWLLEDYTFQTLLIHLLVSYAKRKCLQCKALKNSIIILSILKTLIILHCWDLTARFYTHTYNAHAKTSYNFMLLQNDLIFQLYHHHSYLRAALVHMNEHNKTRFRFSLCPIWIIEFVLPGYILTNTTV